MQEWANQRCWAGTRYFQLWWLVQWNQGRHQGKKMVLGMPSENRQCQGRGNVGRQLILDTGCSGWKGFWGGHWCFPERCRDGYRRGGPEWSRRCVSWKNLSKIQRLLVVQYLESSCGKTYHVSELCEQTEEYSKHIKTYFRAMWANWSI